MVLDYVSNKHLVPWWWYYWIMIVSIASSGAFCFYCNPLLTFLDWFGASGVNVPNKTYPGGEIHKAVPFHHRKNRWRNIGGGGWMAYCGRHGEIGVQRASRFWKLQDVVSIQPMMNHCIDHHVPLWFCQPILIRNILMHQCGPTFSHDYLDGLGQRWRVWFAIVKRVPIFPGSDLRANACKLSVVTLSFPKP